MLNFECPILNVEVKSTVWLVRCTGAFHFKIQPSALMCFYAHFAIEALRSGFVSIVPSW